MTCGCGPGCRHDPAPELPAPVPGELRVSGTLVCPVSDLPVFLGALPEHVRLSRAEPGCMAFDVRQDADSPLTFHLFERFRDRAAFEAHQARTRATDWPRLTANVRRDLKIEESD